MAEIDNKILMGILGLIAGIYGWLIQHLSSSRKHPSADKIVFQDLCDERSKRLDDCIEDTVKHFEQQHQQMREDINNRFDRIEDLIRDGR